jgi:hypothetical protein
VIQKLLGPRDARPKRRQVFVGDDEQFLEHQVRESD